MAWTIPTIRATGDLITSTIWNADVVNNLKEVWRELAYVEVTSDQTSITTTAATATSIVSGGAVTFDGSLAIVEFFCPYATHSVATSLITFQLYDSATDLGTIGQVASGNAVTTGQQVSGRRRLTPSAGSHTYSIRMWSSAAGTTTAKAGAGGAGVMLPFFVRILQKGG